MTEYIPSPNRYEQMSYRSCGKTGLKLPIISLGLWLNFGDEANDSTTQEIILAAFDRGITHIDLANNYGPPPGAAEARFGKILQDNLRAHRDELVISTKAGYRMWPGPYGDGGSRKYLISSCDQSLKRMGLDYVDVFYHHRQDPETPIAESMGALAQLVKEGKALYAGISNYHPVEAAAAIQVLSELHCPYVLDQVRYSMLDRWVEREQLIDSISPLGMGFICFSPLAQGLLTSRYLEGTIPEGSRPTHSRFLKAEQISAGLVERLNDLNDIARKRGQTLAQMALSWILKDARITSVLIGASSVRQLDENLEIINQPTTFSYEELEAIDRLTLV
ncbi:MAG: L-glyceraldehyde 3-phosphate reductase [Spirochaetae bacterium HGW-Spirochaetae-8]|nr:MAG: L-glyceraldehyde 3-phosphate reductase [Spirochaetae bacterium HGW-Spirochaetae-8]